MSDLEARRELGNQVRTEVMGSPYGNASEFMKPLQEMILEMAWGGVWAREGLPRKTRSLVVVAILLQSGRLNELRGHIRGALNNGATQDEIREVLLQVGVYCGVPVAVEGHRVAREVFDALEGPTGQ